MSALTDPESRLIDLAYQAGANPERWPAFLDALSKELNGESANLLISRFSESAPTEATYRRVVYSAGFPDDALNLYRQHFGIFDPFLQEYRRRYITGGVVTCDELLDRNTYRRSEFYNDFARRYNVEYICFARLELGANAASGIGIVRSEKFGRFEETSIRLVSHLLPHVRRAIDLNRILYRWSAGGNCTVEAVNLAVLTLNEGGRIITTSELAEKLLAQEDGLTAVAGHLSASDSAQNSLLQETIAAAIASPAPAAARPRNRAAVRRRSVTPSCGCLAISRSSSKHPLHVFVHPFHSSELLLEDRPCAVIILIDPDKKAVATSAALQHLYGLTPAESRLAELLLKGHDLSECAELLGNSIAGTRMRLKAIMRKTNVSRQSEFIRLFVGFPKNPNFHRA